MRPKTMVEIGLAAGLVGLAAWSIFYGQKKAQEASQLLSQAAEQKGMAATYWTKFQNELEAKNELSAANAKLEAALKERKVQPKPEPPPPAPEEAQAKRELALAGMERPEVLTPLDTRTVWAWSYKAQKYPLLEKRCFDLEGLNRGKDALIIGLKQENALMDHASKDCTQAYEHKSKEAEAVRGALDAVQKEAKAKEVKWWFKAGGAALAAYLAGKHL